VRHIVPTARDQAPERLLSSLASFAAASSP